MKSETKKTTKPKSKVSNPKSQIKVDWAQLYLDLPEHISSILREKRVKPEQLITKTDGEILAYGLSDVDVETIRSKYAPPAVNEPRLEAPTNVGTETPSHDGAEKKALSGPRAKQPRHLYGRSQRYRALLKKVAKDKVLPPAAAITQLIKITKTASTIGLHLNVFDTGLRGEVKVPFSTGKNIRVEVFSDKTIAALNDNRFEFDVLLATPADMPKLAKYAKVLGPKGLMPNPKTGTVTAEPEKRAKELMAGANIAYKTEPKFPIIHIALGKTNQKAEELTANLTILIKEIGLTKIKSAYLTGTQTPSLRLDLSSL